MMGESRIGESRIGRGGKSRARQQAESGFSLIEVMISKVILTVGMVSLLGVFGLAIATTQTSQQNMIAKQLADEALESLITARNTTQMGWDAIQNNTGTQYCTTSASPCGIFLSGAQPMCLAPTSGTYAGILGTTSAISSSACVAGEQTLQDPGADGIYNTTDDTLIPLTGYKRAISILPLFDANSNLIPTLRNVTITIQYATPQNPQATYVLNSYISQYP